MNRKEAILKLGTLTEIGFVIHEANDYRKGFLPGRMTSWGYERIGASLVTQTRSWTALWEAVALARMLASRAHTLRLMLSSESDRPYEPFVMVRPQGDDFASVVRDGLGLAQDELLVDQTVQPATELLFFGQDEVEYARDYLEEEEDNAEPSQAEVLAAIGKNEDETAFSEEEVAGYRELNQLMAQHLEHLHQLSFDWDEAPERYAVSPVMFLGMTRDYVVGLWANRVWT